MIRLWNRVGTFRVLSVAVLLAGTVGGAAMAANRQSQQPVSKSTTFTAQSDLDEARSIQELTREREHENAAARSAQREAQAKADAAAAAAAAQAKAVGDAAAAKAPPPGGSTKPPPGKPPAPPNVGPIPADCNAYTGNPAIGCKLLLQAGNGIGQMPCLFNLWMKESGWKTSSANSSGAYGIPQALPGVKMAPYGADWRTNPVPQIQWGLGYIKGRYGTACNAWAYWQSHGWY